MINLKKEGEDSVAGQNANAIHQADPSVCFYNFKLFQLKPNEHFTDSFSDLLLSENQFLGLDLNSDIVM